MSTLGSAQLFNAEALTSTAYQTLLVNPWQVQDLLTRVEEIFLDHHLIYTCAALWDERLSAKVITVYFSAYANKLANADLLYQYLKEKIPHYPAPTYFIQLETLPMTSEGDLDVNSLPLPDENALLESEVFKAQSQSLPVTWTEASDIHQQNVEAYIRAAESKFATQAIPYISPESGDMGPGMQSNPHPLLSESPLHTGDGKRNNTVPTNTEEGRKELSNQLTHQHQQKLGLTHSQIPTPSPIKQ